MKKRLRKTGEIVDVISYNKYSNTSRNSDLDWVSYIDSEGREYEHEKGLNIYWDFEDVEDVPNKDIDWEQVRIKAAIEVIKPLVDSMCPFIEDHKIQWMVSNSVKIADALIAELKKGGDK